MSFEVRTTISCNSRIVNHHFPYATSDHFINSIGITTLAQYYIINTKRGFMNMIKKAWKHYCDWLDEMGLTPENKRCCVPLDERAQKAIRAEQQSDTSAENKKADK
tara:strand:- start:7245 stop:7562 length:318 start_codon:yes stop_codon:yes gene_type:complete